MYWENSSTVNYLKEKKMWIHYYSWDTNFHGFRGGGRQVNHEFKC